MTLVKICGLTREQDVDQAVEAGADLVGFVCVADSPRGVTLERAVELARRAPDCVRTVAVFAGPEPDGPADGLSFEVPRIGVKPASRSLEHDVGNRSKWLPELVDRVRHGIVARGRSFCSRKPGLLSPGAVTPAGRSSTRPAKGCAFVRPLPAMRAERSDPACDLSR